MISYANNTYMIYVNSYTYMIRKYVYVAMIMIIMTEKLQKPPWLLSHVCTVTRILPSEKYIHT